MLVDRDDRTDGQRVTGRQVPFRQLHGPAAFILDGDARVHLLAGGDRGDHLARLAGDLVNAFLHGLALDHIAILDLAGHFGDDRNGEGVPGGDHRPRFDHLPVADAQGGAVRHGEPLPVNALIVEHGDLGVAVHDHFEPFVVPDRVQFLVADLAATLGAHLGLFHRTTRRAADMKGAHGQLGAGLADGLGRDDAHRLADVDHVAAAQVAAVAHGADAALGLAGEHRADHHPVDTRGLDGLHPVLGDLLVHAHQHFAGVRIDHILQRHAAEDTFTDAHDHLAAFDQGLGHGAAHGAAVPHDDGRILGHVHQPSGEVAGVGGLERGVGQTLAGAVGGDEVLENAQALAEVGLDRGLDDLAGGLGHQAAHPRQLTDLVLGATRARVGHDIDRVEALDLPGLAGRVRQIFHRHLVHHLLGDLVRGLGPDVDDLVVLFTVGDETVGILLIHVRRLTLRVLDKLLLAHRDLHVVDADGDAGPGGVFITQVLEPVGENDRFLGAGVAVGVVDEEGQFLLGQLLVDQGERHRLWQQVADDQPTDGRVHHGAVDAYPHPGLHVGRAVVVGDPGLGRRTVQRALADHPEPLAGHVVQPEDDVLAGNDDRPAVGRREDVVGGHHQYPGLDLGLDRERHVHRHLVAVEVGVEGRADERVELDGLALDEVDLEGLHAQPVQGRGAVEDDRVLLDDILEHVPDLLHPFLHHLAGALDGGDVALVLEPVVDERLEQLERHLLGQTALVQAQVRADDDDRTAGIVHPLTEQVLAEAPLLALEHVGERLERPLVRPGDGAAAAAVVEQHVHRLLQHPFFVADDDVRRVQFQQALQPVVAVDHPPVQVVQVRGGETAALERHQRPQIRRQHRDHLEDHPFRPVAGADEGLDHVEPLAVLAPLGLRAGLSHVHPQLDRQPLEPTHLLLPEHPLHQGFARLLGQRGMLHLVHQPALLVLGHGLGQVGEQFVNRLGADTDLELARKLLEAVPVLLLVEQRADGQLIGTGVHDHVRFEIENALQLLEGHVENGADLRRQTLQKPDMGDRRGQLDMPQPLTTNLGLNNLDPALFADHAPVLHALVLAAVALVVLDRPENLGTEQAVPLGLEGPVVDGLRLLDLTVRPFPDLVRRGQGYLHLVETEGSFWLGKKVEQFFHEITFCRCASIRSSTSRPGPAFPGKGRAATRATRHPGRVPSVP